MAEAQAPNLNSPVPAFNVLNFGAQADAQVSSGFSPAVFCTVAASSTTLTCGGAGIFAAGDVGKSIEVPTAGGTTTAPATLLASITAVSNMGSSKFLTATLSTAAVNGTPTGGVTVTWGTDNSAAFRAAANACPAPTNGVGGTSFTSKGCVLYVPNPGGAGTGDYMFGSGVTFGTQTSFQIIGMGNSGKFEQSMEAGVRFITAMPIAILTVGQNSIGTNNLGGFQIYSITFADTSGNGSALGGLDMIQVSEAVIAYCSFEGFNGQTPDPANDSTHTFPNLLAYGIKSDPGTNGIFNNNSVLLHDKGKNNMVWYDASLFGQDGPIVVGGDIFPVTIANTPATPSFTGACYGIIASGAPRLYGTHFDVGLNNNDVAVPACYGVKLLAAAIINAKFESSVAGTRGNGVLLQGGSPSQVSLAVGNVVLSSNGKYVTVTPTGGLPTFQVGQLVTISLSPPDTGFNGTFIVTSVNPGSSFTYDIRVAPGEGSNMGTGNATGLPVTSANITALLSQTTTGVTIQAGASNNRVTADVVGTGVAIPVSDSGMSDVIQVLGPGPGTSVPFVPSPNFRAWGSITTNGLSTTTTNIADAKTSLGTETAVAATTSEPPLDNLQTTNVNGNVAAARGLLNYLVGKNILFQAYARAVDFASGGANPQRVWIVESDLGPAAMGASDSPMGNYAGFRYSTSAGDTDWQCVTNNNGASNKVVDSTVPVDSNGHRFEVQMSDTGAAPAANFKIDGNQVCRISTQYPTANTLLSMQVDITTLSSAARNVQYSYLNSFQDPRR